ncbi:MAG TPA: hypothetical protein VNG33_22750 [Polyangiaceae bacterium]|nr:hypothetical protein [Polyangiaceae bacterium]
MSQLSREAIFAVLSGLTILGCDKAATVTAEPAASAAASTPLAPAAAAALVSGGVAAKEVPSAQGKAGEKEKSCAPGGCAAGQCGGSKKK